MTDRPPRYYSLDALKAGGADTYFRVLSGGVYERFDPIARIWIHVTSDATRNFYSRAIENGDGAMRVRASDVH